MKQPLKVYSYDSIEEKELNTKMPWNGKKEKGEKRKQ